MNKEQMEKEDVLKTVLEDSDGEKPQIKETLEQKDKRAVLFYRATQVYLNDYESSKKIMLGVILFITVFLGYIFFDFIMLSVFAMLSFLIASFMLKETMIKKVFNLVSNYNSSFKENNVLLRRLIKTQGEQTYEAISFNTKTKNVSKGVEKRYWDALVKEEQGTEKYKLLLENIIENIETMQDLSDLKNIRDKETTKNENE